jgi:hypothetical protein
VHGAAYLWVRDHAPDEPGHVLDIGGRNVNGSPRASFPEAASYTVLDIMPGEGVDIVADAATWQPNRVYDTIVCCEVFEHTPSWPEILVTCGRALSPIGTLIVTTAGPGRGEHSAIDGGALRPGEYYGNVHPDELLLAAKEAGFGQAYVNVLGADVRAVIEK